MSASTFKTWIHEQQTKLAPATKVLEVQQDLHPRTQWSGDEHAETPGIVTPSRAANPAPIWRRLIGFNLLTAVILGIGGYYLGWWIGHLIKAPTPSTRARPTKTTSRCCSVTRRRHRLSDRPGLRHLPDQAAARPAAARPREGDEHGLLRYFSLSTDHKVVAKQYMVGVGFFFFIGGLNAMLIRTELLQPNTHVFGATSTSRSSGCTVR